MLRNMAFQSPLVEIWSDTSGSWGCGAFWGSQWFQVQWSEWPGFAGASIAAKELQPIIKATAIWGPSWRGATVTALCHCDNEAVVAAVKSGYCRDPTLAHMLRCLFFLELSMMPHFRPYMSLVLKMGLLIVFQGIIYLYSLTSSRRLIKAPAKCWTT